jgi:hypothetical protein
MIYLRTLLRIYEIKSNSKKFLKKIKKIGCPNCPTSRTWKAMESNRFLYILHKKKGSHF